MMSLWRRGRSPLMITLSFLPVPLLITAYTIPEFLPFVWVWPLAYFLLDILGTYIRGKKRILYIFFLLAVVSGITVFLGISPQTMRICLLNVLYVVLLLIEMPLSPEDRGEQIHVLKYAIIGVLIHLAAQFLLSYTRRYGNPVLEPVAPWFTVNFFLFIVLGLLLLNGANLTFISQGRLSVSKAMKRKNMLLTLAVAVINVAIALIPGVISALRTVFSWIPAVLSYVRLFLQSLQNSGSAGNGGGDAPPSVSGVTAPQETNSIPPWLETATTVLVIVLVSAVVLYGVYFLIRKLIVFARILGKMLQKYMHAVSEDYVDVITDTRDEDDPVTSREKKQKKLSPAEVRKLTPAGRVRYRYWQLMRKHPEWAKGSTARENLNAAAANVYERVRYSSYPVGEADARNFAEETKKV